MDLVPMIIANWESSSGSWFDQVNSLWSKLAYVSLSTFLTDKAEDVGFILIISLSGYPISSQIDIQEIFNSHYELPELGPLGSNGMALPRDFKHPVASFDLDRSLWESEFQPTESTLFKVY